MAKTKKQKVFIACETMDEAILEHLLSQLSPLERNNKIEVWHHKKVTAGSEREKVILEQLNKSDLILLLISSSFIASDFYYNTLLPKAILRSKKPKVHLIPIIAKSCMWEDTLISSFVALPSKDVPIVSNKWGTLEEPYVQTIKAINNLIKGGKLESIEKEKEEKNNNPGIGNILTNIGNVTVGGQGINNSIKIGDVNINTGDTNKEAEEQLYIDQGIAIFRQKRYEEAIQIFDKVLAINPRNETAYYSKGQIFRLTGRMEEALAAYEMAIIINPNWWRVYAGKAMLYENQKNDAEAIKWYQRAIKTNPNIVILYFRLAYIFHMSGREEDAISYYDRCIAVDPSFSTAYLNKGVLLKSQGKSAEALALYQKAASFDQGNPSIFFNMGNAYLDLRQYKRALENYEITLQLNPNHSKAIAQKEWVLKRI